MIQKRRPVPKEEAITIRMDITVDLPAEMANEVERLGIYEFDRTIYDEKTRRMTVSATTRLYKAV